MSERLKRYRGFLLIAPLLLAPSLLVALLLAPAAADEKEETVTVISGSGAEEQSLETYRNKGTQLYFSYSPLSHYVVPNRRAAPSPYLSGWNHLAPSRYWHKKTERRSERARHTLGYVGDGSRLRSTAPESIDWSKLQAGGATPP